MTPYAWCSRFNFTSEPQNIRRNLLIYFYFYISGCNIILNE